MGRRSFGAGGQNAPTYLIKEDRLVIIEEKGPGKGHQNRIPTRRIYRPEPGRRGHDLHGRLVRAVPVAETAPQGAGHHRGTHGNDPGRRRGRGHREGQPAPGHHGRDRERRRGRVDGRRGGQHGLLCPCHLPGVSVIPGSERPSGVWRGSHGPGHHRAGHGGNGIGRNFRRPCADLEPRRGNRHAGGDPKTTWAWEWERTVWEALESVDLHKREG